MEWGQIGLRPVPGPECLEWNQSLQWGPILVLAVVVRM